MRSNVEPSKALFKNRCLIEKKRKNRENTTSTTKVNKIIIIINIGKKMLTDE